jgi:hypothetical protein
VLVDRGSCWWVEGVLSTFLVGVGCGRREDGSGGSGRGVDEDDELLLVFWRLGAGALLVSVVSVSLC